MSHTTDSSAPAPAERTPRAERPHREVVSFVRRSARMNDSQARAWQRFSDWVITDIARVETSTSVAEQPPLDWSSIFGRTAPLVVEIGSGTGDALVAMAQAHRDHDFIAFEVFEPAVASTLIKLDAAGVSNARIVTSDAVAGLAQLIPDAAEDASPNAAGQLVELCTFFPDPWHKARHHKRRLVTTEFADLVATKLPTGGLWRLATDWGGYAEWMREVLDVHPDFVNEHGPTGADPHPEGWAPRFDERPLTRFEQRGITAGRAIRDLTYRRIAR